VNTSEIISALKIKGSFPTSDDLFSDSDFLVLLNMTMKVAINPLVLKLNEEYFVQTKEYTIAVGSSYRLPKRIITIRDIKLVDSSGNETDLNRCFEEDRAFHRSGYYIVRNSIELSSDITSGTLRVKYFARPSELVLSTSAGQIESIDTGMNQVVVGSAPATFVNGALIDLVQNESPYDLMSLDLALSNVSGTTLTLPSLPDGLAVGDWVTVANQSPVPLIPEELHPVLVQSALVDCLSSKKDKALEVEAAKLEQMKMDVVNMLDPRVNNASVKFRTGRLHAHFGRRWR
jgi:hypothetical protein